MSSNYPVGRADPSDNRSERFWQARQGWLADLAAGIPGLVKFRGGMTITGATTFSGATNLDPWRVEIQPFIGANAQTNWSTRTVDANQLFNGLRTSTGAVNATVQFWAVLSAGTWNLNLMHSTGADRGIYSFDLDGNAAFGTIDGYAAVTVNNTVGVVAGFTVATSGLKRLNITMATKNAASASFVGNINHIVLMRTA